MEKGGFADFFWRWVGEIPMWVLLGIGVGGNGDGFVGGNCVDADPPRRLAVRLLCGILSGQR